MYRAWLRESIVNARPGYFAFAGMMRNRISGDSKVFPRQDRR